MYTNPTKTLAWKKLSQSQQRLQHQRIPSLFLSEKKRLQEFTKKHKEIYFDYSKHLIDKQTLQELLQLAEEMKMKENIEKLFQGDPINETEKKPVLHMALRDFNQTSFFVNGKNIGVEISKTLQQIKAFSHNIRSQKWKGFSGKSIKNIVNIGIGGSDLGPQFVVDALKSYKTHAINVYFVSNVDGAHMNDIFSNIEMDETLFIIVSKTFTTQETMTNFELAKRKFLSSSNDERAIAKHFVAVSSNMDEVKKHSVPEENMFSFWDWVGGRYSLWSSVGLSISLALGYEHFESLLKGANDMDKHFRKSRLEDNIPLLMALISLWNTNFLNMHTEAVIPYAQDLRLFPMYLQQLLMESNGKQVDKNGNFVNYFTSPILWGDAGTNAQHSFFQALHQGTFKAPCDFIAYVNPSHSFKDSHKKLLANCIAQSEALMNGKLYDKTFDEAHFMASEKKEKYRMFLGNIPTTFFLFDKLTPFSLGQLIALYEHKVFSLGVLLNIYSFDQWGVELGKVCAKDILKEVKEIKLSEKKHDPSTMTLIKKAFIT